MLARINQWTLKIPFYNNSINVKTLNEFFQMQKKKTSPNLDYYMADHKNQKIIISCYFCIWFFELKQFVIYVCSISARIKVYIKL